MRQDSPTWSTRILRLRLMSAVVCLLLLDLTVAPPAGADPFGVGPQESGWLADNHDHDYCWSKGFTGSIRVRANEAMAYLEASTDFEGGSLQSCDSGTDIYFEREYLDNRRGYYRCFDRSIGNICDRAYVRITSSSSVLPASQWRKTLCHEIGHSTGADHHSSSAWGCMVSGSSTAEYYGGHTLLHMNNLIVADS